MYQTIFHVREAYQIQTPKCQIDAKSEAKRRAGRQAKASGSAGGCRLLPVPQSVPLLRFLSPLIERDVRSPALRSPTGITWEPR
jgi:hypothetical protein